MATVTFEGATEIISTSNLFLYAFGSFLPQAGSLLVIIFFGRGTTGSGTPAVNTLAGINLNWTLKAKSTFNGGADSIFVFWARQENNPSNHTAQVNVGSDQATGGIGYMFEVRGAVTAGDPFVQVKFNSGTSTNATSGTLAQALDTNNAYVAGWMGALTGSNPANVSTPPTSWTEVGDNGFNNPTSNASGAFRDGGETGTSISFTNASTTWGMVLAEILVDNGYSPRDPIGTASGFFGG